MEQKKVWKTVLSSPVDLENTLNQLYQEGYEVTQTTPHPVTGEFTVIAKLRCIVIPGGTLLTESRFGTRV